MNDLLPFDVVEVWCSGRHQRYEQWTLCFVPPALTGDVGCLRSVCVWGVLPATLYGIRVLGEGRTAYAQQSVCDGVGRASSAGEIVQALFGVDRCDVIRLDAEAFAQPVQARLAEVQLQVRVPASPRMGAILVMGHLA